MLVASGTKDQVYLHVSRMRELKMLDLLDNINRRLAAERSVGAGNQGTLI